MKICIVAHMAYGAMIGGSSGHIGGVERQTTLMAKWLAQRGHEVSLLCWDEGGAKGEIIDGVRVIKICPKDAGLPVVRFFHPRMTGLLRALSTADADLYYHNCGEYFTGQIARWCLRNEKRFVFSVASNLEVQKPSRDLGSYRDRQMFYYGLRRANLVITQTRYQQNELLKNFGLSSTILPMPCPSFAKNYSATNRQEGDKSVLWAGRIEPVKRLELLLDVAEKMPDIRFNVGGKPFSLSPYSANLLERMAALPNVTYHGPIARDDMPEHYLSNSALCCTSVSEGFPNTFLEAWSFGLPIVSTFDPDGLIENCRLGAYSQSIDGIQTHLRQLIQDKKLWKETSANAVAHFLKNYEVDIAMQRFESAFRELLTVRK